MLAVKVHTRRAEKSASNTPRSVWRTRTRRHCVIRLRARARTRITGGLDCQIQAERLSSYPESLIVVARAAWYNNGLKIYAPGGHSGSL